MPVDGADFPVVRVLLVREGLIKCQIFVNLPGPVTVLSPGTQSSPAINEHVSDLDLLEGVQNPARKTGKLIRKTSFSFITCLQTYRTKSVV